jgi:hypothetical protein
VSFISDALELLLNIIVQQGIQGDCSTYCGYLPLQTEAQICTILCEIVGIEAFIQLLTDADPDRKWITRFRRSC